ncbi:IclR family transcriptional regulator [Occultella aeris]|uniref:Glycerol operon regulatory protein n=1 Tax=Occultella aeris TaxID=2761496 RepID=A0A7M4DHE9_9MICO|nr:IclR family transcriptional regulator [Occultella aeris]VZO36342.1 Acetate operon repressor [Occultella aeris]
MQSLSRALGLLDSLARQGQPSTLAELAERTGLHKSTVHRMLAAFLEHDLVRHDDAHRYTIGVGAFELARAANCDVGPDPAITRALEAVSGRSGAVVTYFRGRPEHLEPVVAVRERDIVAAREGPVHWHASAIGKAFLSMRPKAELDRLLVHASLPALTTRTLTDPFRVRQAVTRARMRGYAVEDREVTADRRAIAAPVVAQGGMAVGVIEAVLPNGQLGPERLRTLAVALIGCAEELASTFVDRRNTAPLVALSAPGVGA